MLERIDRFNHLFLNSITLTPEKNKTYTPDAPINNEVPKSGCLAMSNTTKAIATIEITTGMGFVGKVVGCGVAGTVTGTLIVISYGC